MSNLSLLVEKIFNSPFLHKVENLIETGCENGELKRYVVKINERYLKMKSLTRVRKEGFGGLLKKNDWEVRKGVRLYSEEECNHSPASQVPHFNPFNNILDNIPTGNRYALTMEWNDKSWEEYCCLEKISREFDIQHITFTASRVIPYSKRIKIPEDAVLSRLKVMYETKVVRGKGDPSTLEGQELIFTDQKGSLKMEGENDPFILQVCKHITSQT